MTTLLESPTLLDSRTLVAAVDDAPEALVRKHVGLPADAEPDERWASHLAAARQWFREHGRPWGATQAVAIESVDGERVHLSGGSQLTSLLLAKGFAHIEATNLVVLAVTAGPETDERIAHLWQAGRPDEAMFANALAIAVVEHLRDQIVAQLQSVARDDRRVALPHYSPGYDGWDLADQHKLFAILQDNLASASPIQVLPSGGLQPAKSTLAVVGVTSKTPDKHELSEFWSRRLAEIAVIPPPLPAQYGFPAKTLALWRTKRLRFTHNHAGNVTALFRFDGSTCTNMGLPLAFDYTVELRREDDGVHRIVRVDCQPAADRSGYQSMCAYLDNPDRFMAQLGEYRPLVGRTLDEALLWDAPTSPAGCLCSRASQDHKWRAVLHTLHYALQSHE
ncbi:MAG: hypothetical protein KDA44_13020 [Planctomycetales bacterium]|nr:hypothetical protein [Planctomycetales bacterium]